MLAIVSVPYVVEIDDFVMGVVRARPPCDVARRQETGSIVAASGRSRNPWRGPSILAKEVAPGTGDRA
jgi:hypothetical protein